MPIIYSYPLVTSLRKKDTFVITKTHEDDITLDTNSITYEDLRKNIINDSSFIYTQGVPATIWYITHNLNKFPSVTAVNINDVQVFGEVEYIDKNNLNVQFTAGFSGKAYLN